MALDTTGIRNENEFYTDHYLRTILEDDLKDVFSGWREREEKTGIRSPDQELRSLAKEYFNAHGHMEKIHTPEELLEIQQQVVVKILQALGYEPQHSLELTETEQSLPILGKLKKNNGAPDLWIIQMLDDISEPSDPLQQSIQAVQYPEDNSPVQSPRSEISDELSLEEIIAREIFPLAEPPRWLFIISFSFIVLIDRSKWNEKRLLRFDLSEIFGRREVSTFKAMAALLHRDSICPSDGTPLLDNLDENSHKHAFAVSEDLKYSAREAVELLGNEALWYLREKLKEKVYDTDIAGELTSECLRYLYRLLFLFYIEARPELGYVPLKSNIYLKGYSLESLRELEMIPLTSSESSDGFYIDDSLNMLFKLVAEGFNPEEGHLELALKGAPLHNTFKMSRLQSHLFDEARMPIFNRVRLRNKVLQNVIQLLSLSRKAKGRGSRRGRVSYAQLGINQLGAVYEGLLSYRGFFAESDLYEVKRAKDHYDPLGQAFFVPEEALSDYDEDEKVYNADGTLMKHTKGTFIYRLAGRDREKSASYYTPEVLTKCLVKHALKELIGEKPDDGKWKTADQILELTICEPAMGSAAFLNEAVNQLAEAYLQRKQVETDTVISVDDYLREKQKVKMYLADNQVYGIDLNPVAVELAEISLWLNCIHEGSIVPWFGLQLNAGNSLVGARRQVFPSHLVTAKRRGEQSWLDVTPERVPMGEQRDIHTIYHWLLPDPSMADFQDKIIRQLAPEAIKVMKDWRKNFCQPFSQQHVRVLERLSYSANKLWEEHTQQLAQLRKDTTDRFPFFGKEGDGKLHASELSWKDRKLGQELYSENVRNSSPYRRLKLAMDYWCALWFWPIEQAELLPSRDEYLMELQYILEGQQIQEYAEEGGGQMELFPETQPRQQMLDLAEKLGYVDVDDLCKNFERLNRVQQLADNHRFLHWELEFADIFKRRGGFDFVLGNPPWLKVEWNETGLLSDHQPLFAIKSLSASKVAELRDEALQTFDLYSAYYNEYVAMAGTQNFLNAYVNYPLLKNVQTNLYKCFLPQAWMFGSAHGVSGFLHPEGVYDDPKGGGLRAEVFCRLKYHFQFQNELNLFANIDHHVKFSVNILCSLKSSPAFAQIANLFAVSAIDECFATLSLRVVQGIKSDDGKWSTTGHPDRLVKVGSNELKLFVELYDPPGTPPEQARLPAVHSIQVLDVLRKFANQQKRLSDLQGEYVSTVMWDETNAVKKDHTIRRETQFPENFKKWILSGPHFFVGNSFNKTPRSLCVKNSDYDVIDLTTLPADYLPRTNYVPDCDPIEYRRRSPNVTWDSDKKVTDFVRMVHRRMLSQAGERTLIATLLPQGPSHINTLVGTAFKHSKVAVDFISCCCSLPMDFFVKSTGRGDLYGDSLSDFVIIESMEKTVRYMVLIALSTGWASLWSEVWCDSFTTTKWGKQDPRLPVDTFSKLGPEWKWAYPLRTDYARRQALVEIDVLVAMALGLTLEELCTIYRIQFPVLRQNENDTWYDRSGRIVFTCSKGLPGVGFSRPEWNEIKDMHSGSVSRTITDDTLPGGPRERTITYEAPFDRCDREEDYATAWKAFEGRGV